MPEEAKPRRRSDLFQSTPLLVSCDHGAVGIVQPRARDALQNLPMEFFVQAPKSARGRLSPPAPRVDFGWRARLLEEVNNLRRSPDQSCRPGLNQTLRPCSQPE